MKTGLYERVGYFRLIPIYALYLATFGLAGGAKIINFPDVPGWFTKTFEPTLLGIHPLTLAASFYLIALLETATFFGFAVSLLLGEFKPNRPRPILLSSLLLGALTFVALGFGLRLTNDFAGAANLFFYFSGTLVAILYVEYADRIGMSTQAQLPS